MSVSSMPRAKAGGEGVGRHPGIVLAIIVACQMMVVVDATAMSVALPKIQASLHFSATGLAWVLNAYILTYGGLLLLGGRTGDIFGRRRTFVWGVLLFTVTSLLGGLATSASWLLTARALQGVGAAFAAPGAMSLLMTNFAEGAPRHRALAAYSTLAGLGMAVGMILSGVLTDVASWRWVLLVNVPIGVAIVVLTPMYVADPERNPGRLDLPGAVAATLGMVALAWGFIRAASDGWGGLTAGAIAAAVALLALFVLWQARVEHPMMPLRLLTDRTRAAAYLAMALTMACNFNIFLFMPEFLQNVLGYSALTAGVAFLPMALVIFAMSRATPRLLPRFGPHRLVLAGLVLCAAGVAWLTQVTGGTSYATGLLPPLLLVGVGIGTMLMPLTGLILMGVPPRDSGAASGVMQAFQQNGGALGIAVLVTVYGTVLRHTARGVRPRDATAHAIASAFTGASVFIGCAVLAILTVTIGLGRRTAR